MSDQLKVAIIQSELAWENPEHNRQRFKKTIEGIQEPVDLVVLPEMFTSGFTMTPQDIAETMDGQTVLWLQELARYNQMAITGSLVIKEQNQFFNRLLFVHPNGTIDYYNKRHTFTLAGEDKVYTAGSNRLIVEYKGWKICPLVCYDLRFPVWSRNTIDFDMLLYVANWPNPRITAWDSLLKARAIENMSFCVGVNRVGIDNNGHEYSGHSACYDGLGEKLSSIKPCQEEVGIVTLDKKHLQSIRKKLRFLDDRDTFTLVR